MTTQKPDINTNFSGNDDPGNHIQQSCPQLIQHPVYITPTNGEMINENSIKKSVTGRSHDLLSESISALFGGTEKNHKKPSARLASLSQDLNLDCSTQNTSAAHLIVTFSERQYSVNANLSSPLPNHDHHNYIFHATLCEVYKYKHRHWIMYIRCTSSEQCYCTLQCNMHIKHSYLHKSARDH